MKNTVLKILCLASLFLFGLTACDPGLPFKIQPEYENHEISIPVEDQMRVRVTADIPTAIPVAFDAGSTAEALTRRLSTISSSIGPDTRLVLLKGNFFETEGSFDQDMMMELSRAYLRGCYIGLERPTGMQAAVFSLLLLNGIINVLQEEMEDTFGMDGAVAATAASKSTAADRIVNRQKEIEGIATRAGDIDLNEVLAEMLIFGAKEYFMQEPFEAESAVIVHSEESDGTISQPETIRFTNNRTDAISGDMADAIATWLNDVAKSKSPAAVSMLGPGTRAGTSAVNQGTDPSESFTFSGTIDYRDDQNRTLHMADRMNMTVSSWGVHNMSTNKDFYYIKQEVKLIMGSRNGSNFYYETRGKEYWWPTTDYDKATDWFGSFLSQYETSMDLSGKGGTIHLEASAPATDNNTATTTVSFETSYSETSTIGVSFGGTGGAGGFSPSVMGNMAWGVTDGVAFEVGHTTTTKELGVKKNTSGNKVTWTYTGRLPKYYIGDIGGESYDCHEDPAMILVNDCDLTNEICWSVSDPKDRYTVNIVSTPQTAALLMNYKNTSESPHRYEYTTTPSVTYTKELLQPSRAIQEWKMFITIDEWEDKPVVGALGELENTIRSAFSTVYASNFLVADKSEDSMEGITCIINYAREKFTKDYDILKGYAKSWGIRRYSIYWRRDDKKIESQRPFVVSTGTYHDPDAVPQAIWCEDAKTLYFVNKPLMKLGERWDGHNITRVFSGTDVTDKAQEYGCPDWIDSSISGKAVRVVFHESFADARPTSCSSWFYNFQALEKIEGLEYLETSKVKSMYCMFQNCSKLATVNVDAFEVSNMTIANMMFMDCKNLTTIYCGQAWNLSSSNSRLMFSGCYRLRGAVGYNSYKLKGDMANPQTGYFTTPENHASVITLNEQSSNSNMLKRYAGQTVNVQYGRTLSAKINSDGTYTPMPYTVCLPYDLDLESKVNSGQVEIYTLAAVASGNFIFVKQNSTSLDAGYPYLVKVNSGSISLDAKRVVIEATVPKAMNVYSSLAAWRRSSGTVIGSWVGSFDYQMASDATDDSAFALRASDLRWTYFESSDNAWIPAFRSYFTSDTIEKTSYTTRYEE